MLFQDIIIILSLSFPLSFLFPNRESDEIKKIARFTHQGSIKTASSGCGERERPQYFVHFLH